MQPIGMSLDTINPQLRAALGHSGQGAANPLLQSISLAAQFLPSNNLDTISQAAGLMPGVTNDVPAPVNPANVSSAWALMLASQAKSAKGGDKDLYTLLASTLAANTATSASDSKFVNTNVGISKSMQSQSKGKSSGPIDLAKLVQSFSQEDKSDFVPTQNVTLDVATYSAGKSAKSNTLAPATVGTPFDLNYLHQLGDTMASKDPVERLKSFGLDDHLLAPILNLPGVGGNAETAKLLKNLDASTSKVSESHLDGEITKLDSMLDSALGAINGKSSEKSSQSNVNPLLGGLEYAGASATKGVTDSEGDTYKLPEYTASKKSEDKKDKSKNSDKPKNSVLDSFNGMMKEYLGVSSKEDKKEKGSLLDDPNSKPILVKDDKEKKDKSANETATVTTAKASEDKGKPPEEKAKAKSGK